jgi:hypothetical protein
LGARDQRDNLVPQRCRRAIDLRSSDVLDRLDMAFMTSLEARRGRWGGLVDWVFSDLSDDKSAARDFTIGGLPIGAATADLRLGVKTNIVTLAGTYTLVDAPTYTMSLVAGTRMLKTDQTLSWTFSTGPVLGVARSGLASVDTSTWDASPACVAVRAMRPVRAGSGPVTWTWARVSLSAPCKRWAALPMRLTLARWDWLGASSTIGLTRPPRYGRSSSTGWPWAWLSSSSF